MGRRVGCIALALSATILALCVGSILSRRSSEYETAAGRYREYSEAYDPPEAAGGVIGYSSCYGERWDSYTRLVAADRGSHSQDGVYLKAKAARYRRLSRDYDQAAKTPWITLPTGPPNAK